METKAAFWEACPLFGSKACGIENRVFNPLAKFTLPFLAGFDLEKISSPAEINARMRTNTASNLFQFIPIAPPVKNFKTIFCCLAMAKIPASLFLNKPKCLNLY
ncbi:MAG: hypothetical protein M0018_04390 [Nitrospiraceae bacterium]|nr:hypothetical protein [Nitrospiraceae bacterium]